jgi:hypothetical protein
MYLEVLMADNTAEQIPSSKAAGGILKVATDVAPRQLDGFYTEKPKCMFQYINVAGHIEPVVM